MKDSYRFKNSVASLYADLPKPGMWWIGGLATLKSDRKKGMAREVMRRICADADAERVTLVLDVIPDDDFDYPWIITFYESMGFIREGSTTAMSRRPRT